MKTNLLKAEMAKNNVTQKELAKVIGMSEKTFSLKMKKKKFGTDEATAISEFLNIENPELIFLRN